MRRFKDNQDREWKIEVNGFTVGEVRRDTGVLLPSWYDDQMKLPRELASDWCKLVDVLWVLCREQAEATNVSQKEFASALMGDALGSAWDALEEAVPDFFTSPDQREMARTLTGKLRTASKVYMEAAKKMPEAIDANQLGQSCIDYFLNSRESQESTQTAEPLAK